MLIPEARTLDLYEGDTQVSAVAQALERGPENRELLPVLPFQVRSLWQEDDVCYVNLSSAQLEGLDDATLETALEALRNPLAKPVFLWMANSAAPRISTPLDSDFDFPF